MAQEEVPVEAACVGLEGRSGDLELDMPLAGLILGLVLFRAPFVGQPTKSPSGNLW